MKQVRHAWRRGRRPHPNAAQDRHQGRLCGQVLSFSQVIDDDLDSLSSNSSVLDREDGDVSSYSSDENKKDDNIEQVTAKLRSRRIIFPFFGGDDSNKKELQRGKQEEYTAAQVRSRISPLRKTN